MPVGTLQSDFGFLLGSPAAVSAGDVLLLLSLGLHLGLVLPGAAFSTALEGDATHDDGIYVVASECHD